MASPWSGLLWFHPVWDCFVLALSLNPGETNNPVWTLLMLSAFSLSHSVQFILLNLFTTHFHHFTVSSEAWLRVPRQFHTKAKAWDDRQMNPWEWEGANGRLYRVRGFQMQKRLKPITLSVLWFTLICNICCILYCLISLATKVPNGKFEKNTECISDFQSLKYY